MRITAKGGYTMKHKKMASILAAAVLINALSGCSAGTSTETSETTEQTSQIESVSEAGETENLPDNLISNATFETADGWGVYTNSAAAAEVSAENGKLALNITSAGDVSYAVQLYYDTVPLYKNAVYRLSYEIASTINRTVDAVIQQNGGSYQAYTHKSLEVGPEPQVVDYEFTMSKDTDLMARVVFNCGKFSQDLGEHTVFVDNVVLQLVDSSNADIITVSGKESDILVDQVGYIPDSEKIAMFRNITNETEFSVISADTGETVFTGKLYGETDNSWADEVDWYGDFSELNAPGKYYISCGGLDDSYKFEIGSGVYSELLKDMVRMLYLQRCGTEVKDAEFGHDACHTTAARIYHTDDFTDVGGGWHDAGDYGRYTAPACKTIADLLTAYRYAPEMFGDDSGIPESGNGIPDILDEARYGLEWLLKMQDSSGGAYHKVSCADFPGYVMPDLETNELIVTPVSTTATADLCAALAMGYEFFYDIDRNFVEQCLESSERAWGFLEQNPDIIFENPSDITTGDYSDTSDTDERYWAAAQLYHATSDEKYINALKSIPASAGMDWRLVGTYGCLAILTMDDPDEQTYDSAYAALTQAADQYCTRSAYHPYGEAVADYAWASNLNVANNGAALLMAYQLTGDIKYMSAGWNGLHYLLGRNPNGICYVSGYGTVSPQHPHHRPSIARGEAMPGMLEGGPDYKLEDPAAVAFLSDTPMAKCYIDNSESYSTNEVTTYWNTAAVLLLTLAEQGG